MTPYKSRSSAIRAARAACRVALGSSVYEAAEGPDYIIHPLPDAPVEEWSSRGRRCDFGDRWGFELRGPALNPNEENRT